MVMLMILLCAEENIGSTAVRAWLKGKKSSGGQCMSPTLIIRLLMSNLQHFSLVVDRLSIAVLVVTLANSVLRFAFIEFTDEEGARNALSLAGTMLGFYPVRVPPSETAIAPINPKFLPRSEDETEMCARTIYCTNIDKKIKQADVKLFFESICGEVSRLRLLGDYHHSTSIAFVEFMIAESAIVALNCSGAVLGSRPIRLYFL
ncbi:hypothetical protein RD792_004196 [Penstemon davidsonii]|uniref:RRM domain-containing protein n=1 Tax=Penstemon davidsonii TaxID=160366 RepID=A0ABR0DGX2_9LAMI|nr:hypothetical protein RD792_004196 [Penstemon davidsonii]